MCQVRSLLFVFMYWIGSRDIYHCADYLYVIIKCLLPRVEMAGANERHQYHNDTSSDTEDYNDDRRRRVFKNRLRYFLLHNVYTL